MPKVRQDAWSHEDDLLLAETVLRHIREGSTQLRAFDEVGDVLNRTSAACGFRWNAEVRQKYEQAVELAKKQRKEKKREEARQQPMFQPAEKPSYQEETISRTYVEKEPATYQQQKEETALDLNQIINFLKDLQKKSADDHTTQNEVLQLKQDNQRLTEQNQQLTRQLESMADDYQALIQIMDRARKMVMFDDHDAYKPQFRMEKNGNLENVAR
ncbi:RsfA family transcriptional regulator [Halobacillus locisalis]|uniref:RsfA family transcriptional regulator n=1 Tax=Halobacillus locisalis TaxID=220753 RepID=A0A838CMM0_9BACI|nr:RsfA family transcriptional regulator [Halobacillus locisalis]MBA2173492.1 RsfA family transcriptional regulator [Halobacillus locisalis]